MKKTSTNVGESRKIRLTVRVLGAAAVGGALAWFAVAGGVQGGVTGAEGDAALIAEDSPGFAVEDFNYPGADKILAEQNIVLKRGDGHITLADCVTGTGQLELLARDRADKICFNTIGNEGWLTLEIPDVFSIKGNDYSTTVDMTVGTEETSYEIDKNSWTPVGETADPEGRDHMLVEIRVTK
ncbi:Secreted protein [Streptomyces ambofaciens ATCC 23877]|uniref:Secreted protein n=1 Tax=Streptomyces ambofaciens (strain ATCC 23877 / 3486 / DSM 40053 / JCM 4204 / NBRC 12836 / NRRL B-2516) TaxID=278992 RepID=A0A0K2AS58_STRA7|nr:hypothetical protein [Streptomyces ambofaciens]AKZ55834.1 Secreted protein [Streptomyces ambofaciens ATCC 23877]